MSYDVCAACQDEPVNASGDLCARCAYESRRANADLRSKLAALSSAQARAAEMDRERDEARNEVRAARDLLSGKAWSLATLLKNCDNERERSLVADAYSAGRREGAPSASSPAPSPSARPAAEEPERQGADARRAPAGTLVTCEHCSTPHPKDDDDRACLYPKFALAPCPTDGACKCACHALNLKCHGECTCARPGEKERT